MSCWKADFKKKKKETEKWRVPPWIYRSVLVFFYFYCKYTWELKKEVKEMIQIKHTEKLWSYLLFPVVISTALNSNEDMNCSFIKKNKQNWDIFLVAPNLQLHFISNGAKPHCVMQQLRFCSSHEWKSQFWEKQKALQRPLLQVWTGLHSRDP